MDSAINPTSAQSAPVVIEMRDVSFSYGNFLVLDDVNMAIRERDLVSMVGPNGGGKTTLLRLILGLIQPTRGTVRVFGKPPEESRRRIGYMPQYSRHDPWFPVSVTGVVLMGCLGKTRSFGPYRREDKEYAWELLRAVGLHELRNRPFSALSGGQRQRVLIARALASRPELLLLDEPTANLDALMEGAFYDLMSELNKKLTVVMVSHDLGFVSEFVRSVVCVKRQVAVHTPKEITAEVIREMYGGDVHMIHHGHGEGLHA